jgi:hypothetical protein
LPQNAGRIPTNDKTPQGYERELFAGVAAASSLLVQALVPSRQMCNAAGGFRGDVAHAVDIVSLPMCSGRELM